MIPLPNPLSHAYLISGGAGDSRAALARRLTAAYLCQGSNPPCGTCRACRKAAAGAHPDVSLTAPLQGKQEISVEQIRALRSDVYVRPNEGARKVYVIHPADAMNPSAQNALLKVLEEGPAYAAFLLLAGEPGRLLDTVRSRCEPLSLPGGTGAVQAQGRPALRPIGRLGGAGVPPPDPEPPPRGPGAPGAEGLPGRRGV